MRDDFHVPKNYFLSHSVGCQLKHLRQAAGEDFYQTWAEQGGNAWPGWLGVLDKFRANIGWLVGAPAANICPQTNISSGLTKIIHGLPKPEGRNVILLSEQDFPTTGFVLKMAEQAGYKLKFVRGNICDPNVWANAMTDHVAIVHITHALSNSSHLLPVGEICAAARSKHVVTIVDAAQSVGAVPIKLSDWNADFVTGTSVKFICGGPGACFIYVSPEILKICNPVDVGWFSHENPFEMDIDNFKYAPDAMKFFGGTPSPLPIANANAALRYWREKGLASAEIEAALNKLCEQVDDDVLVSPRDRAHRGGAFVIAPKDRVSFAAKLEAAEIKYDQRPEGFRFSVHGYTGEEEIGRLLSVLP